jgi:Pretoxin HINT domain
MAVFVTTQSDLFAFQLDGKSELEMTKTHPVWCETRNGWVLAGELKVGDHIRTATGTACISGIRLAQAGATVYNLSVAGGATFFVGDDKAWVHNCNIFAIAQHSFHRAKEFGVRTLDEWERLISKAVGEGVERVGGDAEGRRRAYYLFDKQMMVVDDGKGAGTVFKASWEKFNEFH